MHDVLRFHGVHGSGVALSDDRHVARRGANDFCNAIVFSEKPIKTGQKVRLEVSQSLEWSSALRIGVTSHDPAQRHQESLPRFAVPELTSERGYWAQALGETQAAHGNQIMLYINQDGQLHYCVNREHQGVLVSGLPCDGTALWLMVDVFGTTTAVKFVPAGRVNCSFSLCTCMYEYKWVHCTAHLS